MGSFDLLAHYHHIDRLLCPSGSLPDDDNHTDSMAVAQANKTANAPISLSNRAANAIRKIMQTKDLPEGYGLRVGVRGGGCSGMSYILGFDRERDEDQTYRIEGIPLYIDKRHGLYLMGTTVDYHDGLNARGFTFENPNATETCGCGSSFAA